MADTQSRDVIGRHLAAAPAADRGAHVGWVVFAGVMFFLVSAFQLVAGLVAILNDEYYVVTKNKLVLHFDYTTWGWIHVAIGIVALLIGICVMAGVRWIQIVGIVLAVISALANVTFVRAYPIWSVILITLDVLVIYALAVHGKDVISD